MAPRPPLALAVGAALTLLVAGCGGSGPPVATVTPSGYIEAVDALLQPPAQIASSISERGGPGGGPPPPRDELDDLVETARARLAAFRAMRLDDDRLRAQRDRLAGAYARMIPPMERAVEALAPAGGGLAVADGLASVRARATLASSAGPFLDALRALPSAASPPSS